jgi:hypothetical protein
MTLPADLAGRRELRLAYQVNDGPSSAPQWRDVAVVAGDVALASGGGTRLRVQQDRGTMEYAGKRMRNVETFRAAILEESELSAP